MKRTIVIGDIHGCFDELRDLLDLLEITADDCIVSTGDLIVKGPRNREVLELFMSDNRFASVLGNHDRALLRHWREGRKLSAEQEECRRQLEDDHERFAAYIASMKLYIDLGTYTVVHAGVRFNVKLADQSVKDLTTMRTLAPGDPASRDGVPWYDVYADDKFIVFGHWASREPRRGHRALGIDTGCVYGNRLTAFIVETNRLLSVPARATYSDYGRPLP